jgi:N-succinyldiaminopimelate aminotransferase
LQSAAEFAAHLPTAARDLSHAVNSDLDRLQSYPFQKLSTLLQGTKPNPNVKPISLHIGEPKHATPEFIRQALIENLGGLANYPTTLGGENLREAIAGWLTRRYGLQRIDAKTEIIPVNGSREALFAFAQTVVDRTLPQPTVVMPNPFYQIYEGAALLAGAAPEYLHTLPGA